MNAHRNSVILGILASAILFDQFTKSIAQAALKGEYGRSYLANTLRLEYAENPGAFLSLGAHMPDELRFLFFTVLVGIFLVMIFAYLIRHKELPLIPTLGMSFILGGGTSNLLDRIFREGGHVVDFLNMGIGSLRTGIFNIADVAIMLGIALLVWSLGLTVEEPSASPSTGQPIDKAQKQAI